MIISTCLTTPKRQFFLLKLLGMHCRLNVFCLNECLFSSISSSLIPPFKLSLKVRSQSADLA